MLSTRSVHAILLLIAAILWGLAFVASKWALVAIGPFSIIAIRFFMAGPLSLLFMGKKGKGTNRHMLKLALIASIPIFLGMAFQIVGLMFTTVAKSGFITCFYAIFTPMLEARVKKKKFSKAYWTLVFISMLGVAMMCRFEWGEFSWGDFLTLLSAFFFAVHIVYLERILPQFPSAFAFNGLQSLFMGLWGLIMALIIGDKLDLPVLFASSLWSPGPLLGILLLGTFVSVVAFTIQIHCQKKIPPNIVALIFLLESPFAAVFGHYFLGEVIGTMEIGGMALIMASVALLPFSGPRVSPNRLEGIV